MGVISEMKGLVGDLGKYFRVPNTSGPIFVYKDLPSAIGDIQTNKIGEIEREILNKFITLASRVKLEFDVPQQSMYKRWEKKLEPAYTFVGSMQRYIWLMLLNSIVDIVFIKDKGLIKQVKFFITHSDNHGIKGKDIVQYTDYIDETVTFEVDKRDISQVTRYADGNWGTPKNIRVAENQYWKRMNKLNDLIGVVKSNEADSLQNMYDPEKKKRAAFQKWSKEFSDQSLVVLPQEHELSPAQLIPADLTALRENIVESYCNHYQLPSPLYYININAHTDVTLASAYTQFRLCLAPIFEQLTQALSEQFGTEVTADYSALEIAAGKETLEMSQTGIYNRNELRKMKNLKPVPDGDKPPVTAGTGTKEDKEKDNGEDNNKD